MVIILNGKQTQITENMTLTELVKDFDISRIAVEINGEIVKKSTYSERILMENDEIEVVTFVGGG